MKAVAVSITVAIGLLLPFTGQAMGAGETAAISSEVNPITSDFFKTVPRAADVKVRAAVNPAPGSTSTRVMESVSIDLPETVTAPFEPFFCDGTDHVSASDYEGELIASDPPSEPIPAARSACSNAIIGDGTAVLHPAGDLSDGNQLTADLLVVGAGLDPETHDPVFAIIGDMRGDAPYAGFILRTALVNSKTFEIAMKAVKAIGLTELDLGFPGEEGDSRAIFSATCPGAQWKTVGGIQVGNAGDDEDPELLPAASTFQSCVGAPDKMRTVNVIKSGSGTGTVYGTEGLTCGDICSVTVKEDITVSLSVQPSAGSEFAGWDGCDVQVKASCILAGYGDRTVRVRFERIGPVPPPGTVGLSINKGDRYTNDLRVRLSIVWPEGSTSMTVSGDRTFAESGTYDLTPTLPWRLASPHGRPVKSVYLRFDGAEQTFSDQIILDQTSPWFTHASAKRRSGLTRVKLGARDRISGVGRMQVSDHRSPRVFKAVFRKKLVFDSPARKIYVRVFDRAGNASRWRTLKVKQS